MKLPSKSPSEALAACVAAYGERGAESAARITSANRNFVKTWLVANGIASVTASSFGLDALREIWSDASDDTLGLWRNASRDIPSRDGASDASDDDAAEKLAQALRDFTASKAKSAPLDENRVVDLIRKHSVQTVRHELALPNGKTTTLSDGAYHPAFAEVLAAINAGLNVMLIGPAGSGKTHLCEQIAKALDLAYRFNGAVSQKHDLLGYRNPMGDIVRTSYRDSYEHGGLHLFDEIDGSSAQALIAFNAGFANGAQDFPDGVVQRHADFRIIASANTFGMGADHAYVGRNQLDAASLDRFYMVVMGYCATTEKAIYCGGKGLPVSLFKPRPLSDADRGDWVSYVHKAREGVALHRVRHVVSARAIANGLKALEAGIPRAMVEKAVLWKNMDAATIAKVRGAM